MNLVLIAPPAAGKGTMAHILNEKYGMIQISVGQLLRDIDSNTSLGQEIRKCQENRELVNNKIVYDALSIKLSTDEVKQRGFILDGFPRSIEQAEILNKLSNKFNFKIDKIIYLDVPYEVCLKRTLGRYTCSKCKTVYNTETGFNDPIDDKVCRLCGAPLEQRNDDNIESFNKGYKKFETEILPLIDYYRKTSSVITVDGSKDVFDTFKELEKKLEIL